MYLLGTTAAYWSEDYKTAVQFLNEILTNKKTPYFYLAHFKRAEVYNKLKQYDKALKDYGEISNSLLGDKRAPDSLGYKTQVLVGITYILKGDIGKALAGMGGAIMSVMSQDEELAGFNKKEVTPEEKALQGQYIEDALFLSACCQNKLGKKKELRNLLDLYKRNFPQGMYKDKLANLPSPEAANKE